MSDCLFCKRIAGEIPSTKVYEDEWVYAFLDIDPQAPFHAVIVPKIHIASAAEINAENDAKKAASADKKAESKKSDIKLQEADYGVFSGVATYAGIKKPLPLKMQKILFTILSAIQTLWLLFIGTLTSIATITCDCFDCNVDCIR